MAARFTVQADTEQECREELARLCRALDATPTLRPRLLPGAASWMARAECDEKAPILEDRGFAVS